MAKDSWEPRGSGRTVRIGSVEVRLQRETRDGEERVAVRLDDDHMIWPHDCDPTRALLIRRNRR